MYQKVWFIKKNLFLSLASVKITWTSIERICYLNIICIGKCSALSCIKIRSIYKNVRQYNLQHLNSNRLNTRCLFLDREVFNQKVFWFSFSFFRATRCTTKERKCITFNSRTLLCFQIKLSCFNEKFFIKNIWVIKKAFKVL